MATAVEPSPGGIPRGVLILVGLASATIAIGGVRSIASLVAPAFLALVLVITVHPIRVALSRRGWPNWLGTLAVAAAVYAVLITLAVMLIVSIAQFAGLLPTYKDEFQSVIANVKQFFDSLNVHSKQADAMTSQASFGNLSGWIGSLLSSLLSTLSDLFFVLMLLIFLAMDSSWFPAMLGSARKLRPNLVEAMESFAHGTRMYFAVSTIFGLIVAIIDTLLLAVMGVPSPVLWGLLAFITNYIPNIGFIIGLIPPAVLGLLEGGPKLMLAVIVAYCVVNLIIQSIIQPKFVGDAVGLSTSITFLSLVFWTWVLGPLGALLAIPLSLLVRCVWFDVDPGTQWARPLISGPPSARSKAKAAAVDPKDGPRDDSADDAGAAAGAGRQPAPAGGREPGAPVRPAGAPVPGTDG
jgi:predicted PurR-regulated permease PerM